MGFVCAWVECNIGDDIGGLRDLVVEVVSGQHKVRGCGGLLLAARDAVRRKERRGEERT